MGDLSILERPNLTNSSAPGEERTLQDVTRREVGMIDTSSCNIVMNEVHILHQPPNFVLPELVFLFAIYAYVIQYSYLYPAGYKALMHSLIFLPLGPR